MQLTEAKADGLHNLLLQCAIQTQLSYHNEFKNELASRWLESHLGHEHLKVVRVSDRGGGRLYYKGFMKGLRCSWRDYLHQMLRSPQQKYECEYTEGTADLSGQLDRNALQNYAGPSDAPWAAASASRRSNPYLEKPKVRSFTEIIEPQRIARGLMAICSQLSAEWLLDVQSVAAEGELLAAACSAEKCELTGDDSAPMTLVGEKAIADPTAPLPSAITAGFRAVSLRWGSESDLGADGEGGGDPSPFRDQNYDMLTRAVTKEAAVRTLSALTQLGEVRGADADWLRNKLLTWIPRFETPPRRFLANIFLIELLQASPQPQQRASGKLVMSNPGRVVAEVLAQREAVVAEWSAALPAMAEARQALLGDLEREMLEASLQAS